MTTRSDMRVWENPNGQAGSDLDIALAAWVSTGADTRDHSDAAVRGLIRYLMAHRHGTPFEEGYLSVTIEVPIFVAREWMRHRIGSYNEISGRYTELQPVFWVPGPSRGVVNVGSSARPKMATDEDLRSRTVAELTGVYLAAWQAYRRMLDAGVAREVARAVLPVAVYTRFRARLNPRMLMSFISLRIDHPENWYPTFPQREIQDAAELLEAMFAAHWPITHAAWVASGRVAP